jgi:predicted esterase
MSGTPRPEARTIAATTHGRFLLSVPKAPGPHPLLMGFHGYGENAERHLEALRAIPGSAAWLLCAVQALHRFYDRKTETVVGCWMTKQDRTLAIADNVAYVRGVLEALRAEGWDGTTLVYAGFSQGVAMAYRAAAFAGIKARGLIALAGDLPEDVRATGMAGFPPLLIGTGRLDPWYTPLQLAEDAAALKALTIQPETAVFEGGHDWTEAFRSRVAIFLEARLREAGEGKA